MIYAPRMQNERMQEDYVPSLHEYVSCYQINAGRLAAHQVLMHPGPVNRGVELSSDVVDSPQALADYQAAKKLHKAEWQKS